MTVPRTFILQSRCLSITPADYSSGASASAASSSIPLYSTAEVAGFKVEKHLGLVTANAVLTNSAWKEMSSIFTSFAGGELHEFTLLQEESRDVALARLQERAKDMGANAVLGVRFATSSISGGKTAYPVNGTEFLVFGTAVVVSTTEL